MKVLIFPNPLGYGHIMRQIPVAERLIKEGFEVDLVCDKNLNYPLDKKINKIYVPWFKTDLELIYNISKTSEFFFKETSIDYSQYDVIISDSGGFDLPKFFGFTFRANCPVIQISNNLIWRYEYEAIEKLAAKAITKYLNICVCDLPMPLTISEYNLVNHDLLTYTGPILRYKPTHKKDTE